MQKGVKMCDQTVSQNGKVARMSTVDMPPAGMTGLSRGLGRICGGHQSSSNGSRRALSRNQLMALSSGGCPTSQRSSRYLPG